jgi:hypothetical protein
MVLSQQTRGLQTLTGVLGGASEVVAEASRDDEIATQYYRRPQTDPYIPLHVITYQPAGREKGVSLSSVQSLYDCRAEVIIVHAPSTSDACETHAQHVEKSIAI